MSKAHYIHLYQPPAQGTAFVAQHLAVGYMHSILAQGSFDSAAFRLYLTPAAAELAFDAYLGCIVRVYVDNPEEPAWEGYISRLTMRVGGIVVTRSVDAMMNRASVTYYNADSAAATKTEQTAVANNTVSQSLWGIKEGSVDGGIHYSNADKTHKTALRGLMLNLRAYPQVSAASGEGGDGVIEVECLGLQYFAWDWQNYVLATNAVNTASAVFRRVTVATLAEAPSNAALIYETDPAYASADRLITTNTAFNMPRGSQSGQTYLQFLQSLCEAGDGLVRYVFGITPPDPVSLTRLVYYQPADLTIKYTAYANADPGRLRDLYGKVVPGWRVRPDAGVRINDILTGWDEAGDDPRIGYIESIQYDAETGRVQWATSDDITIEGALQRNNRFKLNAANNPFAANPRQTL